MYTDWNVMGSSQEKTIDGGLKSVEDNPFVLSVHLQTTEITFFCWCKQNIDWIHIKQNICNVPNA